MALPTGSHCSGICAGIAGVVIVVLSSVLSLCCFAVSRAYLLSPLCSFHLYKLFFCCPVLNAGTFLCNVKIWVIAIYCLFCFVFSKLFSKDCFFLIPLFACFCLWNHKQTNILFKNNITRSCFFSVHAVNRLYPVCSFVICTLRCQWSIWAFTCWEL